MCVLTSVAVDIGGQDRQRRHGIESRKRAQYEQYLSRRAPVCANRPRRQMLTKRSEKQKVLRARSMSKEILLPVCVAQIFVIPHEDEEQNKPIASEKREREKEYIVT